ADLAWFDEASSSWVVDAGTYNFLIGASSRDIKATLQADVTASSQKVNDILKPKEPVQELKR
ncbi:MAG: fibronectin type III-like domain-contianing protein, partial [Bacteroides sp.]|nr:fibronectin type III-like domain-contianing protein [Bacteroides sp.]